MNTEQEKTQLVKIKCQMFYKCSLLLITGFTDFRKEYIFIN